MRVRVNGKPPVEHRRGLRRPRANDLRFLSPRLPLPPPRPPPSRQPTSLAAGQNRTDLTWRPPRPRPRPQAAARAWRVVAPPGAPHARVGWRGGRGVGRHDLSKRRSSAATLAPRQSPRGGWRVAVTRSQCPAGEDGADGGGTRRAGGRGGGWGGGVRKRKAAGIGRAGRGGGQGGGVPRAPAAFACGRRPPPRWAGPLRREGASGRGGSCRTRPPGRPSGSAAALAHERKIKTCEGAWGERGAPALGAPNRPPTQLVHVATCHGGDLCLAAAAATPLWGRGFPFSHRVWGVSTNHGTRSHTRAACRPFAAPRPDAFVPAAGSGEVPHTRARAVRPEHRRLVGESRRASWPLAPLPAHAADGPREGGGRDSTPARPTCNGGTAT